MIGKIFQVYCVLKSLTPHFYLKIKADAEKLIE